MTYSSNVAMQVRRRVASFAWLVALGFAALPVTGAAAEPLAMQGIMKDLGKNMQAIVAGLSQEDYAAVEKAALAIIDHPQPSMDERKRVMAFVGTEAPRFKGFDKETHDHAGTVANAAKGGNGGEAIVAFQKLQSSCLGCHQAFRKNFKGHFYGKDGAR